MNTKLTSVLFLSIILFFLAVNPSLLISQQNDKATSLKPSDASYNVVKKAFWLAFQEYKKKVKDDYSVKPPVDPTGTFCVNDNGQMDIKNNNSPNQNHNASNVINNDLIISNNGESYSPHGLGTEKDLASSYTFAQSTTTYTAINTTGTQITSGCDDSYYLNYPIGFSFNFNGTAYTAFCVSCNGWMNLGTTGTNTYYTPICDGSTPATLSPFAGDLYGTATGNGIYYQTTGTAPNRVFILEWHNWGFYSSGLNEMSFEVKLYETSNVVQFVYQPNTPSYSSNLQVGIMGATNADYNTRTSTTGWSNTTAGTACSSVSYSTTYYPSNGLTYTWTPQGISGITPLYYNFTNGTSSNSFPFNVSAGKETQYLFLAGDFVNPTPAPAGNITKVYVYMSGTGGTATFTNLVIKLGQSTITTLPTSIYPGPFTTVDSFPSIPLASTANSWLSFTLSTPFAYNPAQSLILDIYQCGYTGTSNMTVWNTMLSGGRRNYINETSCVPSYGGQDASTLNFGVDISLVAPSPPTLVSPPNNSTGLPLTDTLVWNASPGAASYRVQLATDSLFASLVVNDSTVTTTSRIVSGLINNTKYYWRVNAKNAAGTSNYSAIWNFMTIIAAPATPTLIAPANHSVVYSPNVLLDWSSVVTATSYRVQLSIDSTFASVNFDTTTAVDSARTPALSNGVKYFWHVRAQNLGGNSSYSAFWDFTKGLLGITTNGSIIPKVFKLYYNYPNPFNPSTTIKFDIPKSSDVKLVLYNALGQEVLTLVNSHFEPGAYSFEWNATNFSSGIYFYRINAGIFTDIHKMVLIK
jgi:hypothetical protein